jgi:pyruvate/2-oxoglutarate dehydrogenase complex dihydrolipoamide acyltransferase (E2) component
MAQRILLPKLGANVAEGSVGDWHVSTGDEIAAGDSLVEIITSKATFDVESDVDGLLASVLAPKGSVVPAGYVLAVVVAPGEESEPTVAEARLANEQMMAAARAETTGGDGVRAPVKVKATPGARRLAKAEGVDLGDVPAGASGVVREEDIRRFLQFRREL